MHLCCDAQVLQLCNSMIAKVGFVKMVDDSNVSNYVASPQARLMEQQRENITQRAEVKKRYRAVQKKRYILIPISPIEALRVS